MRAFSSDSKVYKVIHRMPCYAGASCYVVKVYHSIDSIWTLLLSKYLFRFFELIMVPRPFARSHAGSKSLHHHCCGASVWIGDISPGNCDPGDILCGGIILKACKKHNMACPQGCRSFCLRNQRGCITCVNKWNREAAEASRKKEKERKDKEKGKKDAEFEEWMNSGSTRKRM